MKKLVLLFLFDDHEPIVCKINSKISWDFIIITNLALDLAFIEIMSLQMSLQMSLKKYFIMVTIYNANYGKNGNVTENVTNVTINLINLEMDLKRITLKTGVF